MPKDGLDEVQKRFLDFAKKVAMKMGENGKSLTGVIGELSACEKLGLSWEPQDGWDAERNNHTYQIKTRKNQKKDNPKENWWKQNKHRVDPNGRMGRFEGNTKWCFNTGLYVELDEEFEVWGIWELDKSGVEKLEKNHDLGLRISAFKKAARIVYQKDSSNALH